MYQNRKYFLQEAGGSKLKSDFVFFENFCHYRISIPGINPCASVICSYGEECSINKFGIAHCECPQNCEPVMRPVCSKEGRTFPSECEMHRSACLSRTPMEIGS